MKFNLLGCVLTVFLAGCAMKPVLKSSQSQVKSVPKAEAEVQAQVQGVEHQTCPLATQWQDNGHQGVFTTQDQLHWKASLFPKAPSNEPKTVYDHVKFYQALFNQGNLTCYYHVQSQHKTILMTTLLVQPSQSAKLDPQGKWLPCAHHKTCQNYCLASVKDCGFKVVHRQHQAAQPPVKGKVGVLLEPGPVMPHELQPGHHLLLSRPHHPVMPYH